MNNSNIAKKYSSLILQFIDGTLPAEEFEIRFLKEFKQEPHIKHDKLNKSLCYLFGEVDAYCADETLRDEYDIDEIQLLNAAQKTLIDINKLLEEN